MKKLLVIVDFQKDFIDGTLGFDSAVLLEDKIINKIKEYRTNSNDVIFTLDTHSNNYMNTLEGKKLPVKHCIKGTEGHELYNKLKYEVLECDFVFEKDTFPSLKLAKHLENCNYEEVEVCGLVSNICVISNVIMIRSALPNANIIVDYELTSSYDEDLNKKTFDILKGLLIEVRNYE